MIDIGIRTRLQLGRLLLGLLHRCIEALGIDHTQVTHNAQTLHLVVDRGTPALQVGAQTM